MQQGIKLKLNSLSQTQLQFKMTDVNLNTPLQLIRFKDNRFEIPQQTKEFLKNFKNPLAVITIVGKYRTGKSLFLNKVLLRNSTFKVCPTINSCTKGLWMCRQTIKSQGSQEIDVLVIDTEGFGATEQTDAYNNKILLFALLLSSYFIYNSVGSIDETSLNNLTIIANLVKDIQNNNNKDSKLEEEFPSFLWLVRDFTLNLVDKNGCSIQAKQYLEQALQFQKGTSDAIENKNKIRRMIKHFFKDRDCFTMVRPVDTQEKLQNLLALSQNEFRLQFVEQVTLLRYKILKKIKSKRIKGKSLDGEMLLQLASTYVQAINMGTLPNFEMSYKHIMKYQLNKTMRQFISSCSGKLKQYGQVMHTQAKIISIQEELAKDLQLKFKECVLEPQQQTVLVNKLRKQIKEMIIAFDKENHDKISKNCQQIWYGIYDSYKNFNEYCEIQQYFNNLSQQFDLKIKNSGNPLSPQIYKSQLLTHKCQRLTEFIQKYHEQSQITISNSNTQLNSLQQQFSIQKSKVKDMQSELYELNRQHLKLGGKYNELQKVKQMEVAYLRQKQTQNNQQIMQLLAKNQELLKELEVSRVNFMELQLKNQQNYKNLRQTTEEKRLTEKQLEIIRNNLSAKTDQASQLKTQLAETSIRLENAFDKQVTTLTKHQFQLEKKNAQIFDLKAKGQIQQQSIMEMSKNIIKLQNELSTIQLISQREKHIYEDMFQNLKESLKSQSISREGLIETNKNLSSALKHMEKRAEQAEEKEKQLKQYKKCVKNASCLQCQHCTKFFVPSIFIPHLNVCLIGPQALKNTRVDCKQQKSKIEIKIKQTLVKQIEGKPYTEYVIQFKKNNEIWTVNRKYKAFCDLNAALKSALPGVQLSDVSYIVNPQEVTKKSLVIEQRRKILQKYLNDLCSNPLVSISIIWKEFIEEKTESLTPSLSSSPLKENRKLLNQEQTPEQFFKIWNQRKMRGKQSSMSKKFKPTA